MGVSVGYSQQDFAGQFFPAGSDSAYDRFPGEDTLEDSVGDVAVGGDETHACDDDVARRHSLRVLGLKVPVHKCHRVTEGREVCVFLHPDHVAIALFQRIFLLLHPSWLLRYLITIFRMYMYRFYHFHFYPRSKLYI